MSEPKTVTVVGATGKQGGGLARVILGDESGAFAVRAVTRSPDSDAARALAEAGAEIVRADLDDLPSLEEAFDAAWGAYCVTNFWEHFSPDKELEQAENMAEAAARAGVRHVVWSTLEDTRRFVPLSDDRMPTLMERYKVPHFDAKGRANAFFTERSVPTTFLHTSYYWDNLLGTAPRRNDDGDLVLELPMADAKLPGIAADDIGRCAYGILRRSPRFVGRTVGIAGGHLTGEEMAASLGEVLGEEVTYITVPFEVYRDLDFPGAEDLGNMFQFKVELEDAYCGARDLELSRRLNPELRTFDEWLVAHRDELEIT